MEKLKITYPIDISEIIRESAHFQKICLQLEEMCSDVEKMYTYIPEDDRAWWMDESVARALKYLDYIRSIK